MTKLNSDILVLKKNNKVEKFDSQKIYDAVFKTFEASNMGFNSKSETKKIVKGVIETFTKTSENIIQTEKIDNLVLEKLLSVPEYYFVGECYKTYSQMKIKEANSGTILDAKVLNIVEKDKSNYVYNDNSNKNTFLNYTQRDLITGEVSKSLSERGIIPPDLILAHNTGQIHIHDLDYYIQGIINCCLVNIGDMLDNDTTINNSYISSPNSFQVACTITTQIIAQVSSGQYGGQSIDIKHLAKYLKRTKNYYQSKIGSILTENTEEKQKIIDDLVKKELRAGVQTIQYQINTLLTSNGQSPFVTIFMDLGDEDREFEFQPELEEIIIEILQQRYEGTKNKDGVPTTPTFPKLIYVLYDHNNFTGGKYDFITEYAIKCSSRRMYPDYISAAKMKENYGHVFSPMGCRSFLSPWYGSDGKVKFEGRFNQGVISLNLPQIGILSQNDESKFFAILEKRLKVCRAALMHRHTSLWDTNSNQTPIHWQHGALARLKSDEKINKFLLNGYSTLSLGYIGLYEATVLVKGVSHTDDNGSIFALKVMTRLRDAVESWKAETGLGFALYGTPSESLCYRFADIDFNFFGEIKDVTDKGYYINSYHVDVREEIDAFSKLIFESQFQDLSTGGCISYIEIPNMNHNLEALRQIIRFISTTIQYAEVNLKTDYCYNCHFEGEILINDDLKWECPGCGCTDQQKMQIIRRTCGYLGANYWNKGKTKELKDRVLHL